MATRRELERSSRQRKRIDAKVRPEALILVGQQKLEISWIDIRLRLSRQPPASIGHGEGTEQFSVAIHDRCRDTMRLGKRQRR